MKNTLKITLACLLFVFCVTAVQAAGKYERDSPPEPVKVSVENGSGEVQIVFKWKGDSPPAEINNYRVTDAVGSFNTIATKDIRFWFETVSAASGSTPAPMPVSGPILIARLKVETLPDFKEFSAPYTGHIVFFSDTPGAAPDAVKFELQRKRIDTVASFFDNSTLTLAGTNFLPSLLNPLIPALVYFLLGILFWRRGQFPEGKLLLFIVSALIILAVGAWIGLKHNPGPKCSTVYVDGPQLTQGRNDQSNFQSKEIGILTSEKSGWGRIYLEKKGGDYYLTFPDLPRAGEYNGKIPNEFISTTAVSVKVKVADWVLYFLITVLAGIVASKKMTKPLTSSERVNAFILAAGSVLAVLVTHFTLYTDTWGSAVDYVKAFAAGAGANLASTAALVLAHRIARRFKVVQ